MASNLEHYRYSISLLRSWSIFELEHTPEMCVRFLDTMVSTCISVCKRKFYECLVAWRNPIGLQSTKFLSKSVTVSGHLAEPNPSNRASTSCRSSSNTHWPFSKRAQFLDSGHLNTDISLITKLGITVLKVNMKKKPVKCDYIIFMVVIKLINT